MSESRASEACGPAFGLRGRRRALGGCVRALKPYMVVRVPNKTWIFGQAVSLADRAGGPA